MSQYKENDKFLIEIFPSSLTDPTGAWFVILINQIISCEVLINAFLIDHKFNSKISPDQFDLQKESIKSKESVYEYQVLYRKEK